MMNESKSKRTSQGQICAERVLKSCALLAVNFWIKVATLRIKTTKNASLDWKYKFALKRRRDDWCEMKEKVNQKWEKVNQNDNSSSKTLILSKLTSSTIIMPKIQILKITPGFHAQFASTTFYQQIYDSNFRVFSKNARLWRKFCINKVVRPQ